MESKSSWSLIVSSRAQKEIIASFDWYEERQQGLGDKFIAEVQHKIKIIGENPQLFSAPYKAYREALLKIFPILVIYRINKRKNIVTIVAVFHTARNFNSKYTTRQ